MLSLATWLSKGGDAPSLAATPEHSAIYSETRGAVWQAVQQLSPTQREAILLRYWASQGYQEMALILGCPLRTAQSRVRAAYKQLAQMLAHDDIGSLVEEEAS